MAGRGRGRGRGLSINIEALGLGRGEILQAVVQPPPLFPPLQFKPVPLSQSEDLDYMLALKQELHESFHQAPFFIKAPDKVKDIERYSDKYLPGAGDGAPSSWTPDWKRLPNELRERQKRKRKILTAVKPNLKAARSVRHEDVATLLEKLEETDVKTEAAAEVEEEEGDEEKKKDKDEEDEDEDAEEYDEEDVEEETDYNLSYFDNGEGYGDDDEDDDEGPTY